MTLTTGMVTFDTHDAVALADWWARQTGGKAVDASGGEYVMVTPAAPGGLTLSFQRVQDPTPGKNRLHLDLSAVDREAEVERLLADGASLVARHDEHSFAWVVLADPEGNQFCVAQG